MSTFESVEEIQRRWNQPATYGGLTRMVGDNVPVGDGRATAAAGNRENETHTSSKTDAGLATGVTSMTPEEGGVTTVDEYSEWSQQELRDEIEARNADAEEGDKMSKGGSAEDLRKRIREDNARQEGDGDE